MAKKSAVINVAVLGDAKKLKKALDDGSTSIGNFTKGAVTKFATVATGIAGISLAAGTMLLKVGSSFQGVEATIIKGTGASGAALESMADSVKEIAKEVPQGLETVGAAVADANTFFAVTGEEMETLATTFLNFARLTDTDVSQSMRNIRGLMSQFGFSVEDVDEVLGDFVRIAQATGTPMATLLQQMETFGPLFTNAGFSVEQTAAIFGQLERAGVSVTRIGPGLNKFFRDAAERGADPMAALRGTVAVIESVEDSSSALNVAMDKFGAEGAQRLVTAIRTGNFELSDFNDLIGKGTGTVNEQAAEIQSLNDKFSVLKNQILVAIAPLAERVFDAVSGVVDKLGPMLDTFTDKVDEDGLISAISWAFGQLLEWWNGPNGWDFIKTKLGEGWDALWKFTTETLPTVLDNIGTWLTETGLPAFATWATEAADAFAEWASETGPVAIQKLEDWALESGPEVLRVLSKLAEAFTLAGIELAGALIKGLAATLAETPIIGDLFEFAGFSLKKLQEGVELLTGVNPIGGGGFDGIDGFIPPGVSGPFHPGFAGASGAIVRKPTFSLIGESGPEMVLPLSSAPGASALPGSVINVNMPPGSDGDDVVNALSRWIQVNGPLPSGFVS